MRTHQLVQLLFNKFLELLSSEEDEVTVGGDVLEKKLAFDEEEL
jgi:hypothetical protein